ncbi:MAG: DUF3857 domain-containing protein [Candidatus Omnitrophota bacterium]
MKKAPLLHKRAVFVQKILSVLFLSFTLSGCALHSNIYRARMYGKNAEASYRHAVAYYRRAIAQAKAPATLRFELGRLYYDHGDFKAAIAQLQGAETAVAQKLLGIAYYRAGDFADALEVFGKQEPSDDEYRYYYGLASEKLNLFDQAIALYRTVASWEFLPLASERLSLIEKEAKGAHIQDKDQGIAQLLQNAPPAEKYPQAGALVLLSDEKIEVTEENTQTFQLHYLIKVLNERGKESYSEVHVGYDSTYEKVELEYARTIKPDGTFVEVGSRHLRDVSRYLNFPLYSNARVFIISFPEISDGAAIEYKIRVRRNRLINDTDFVVRYPLQAQDPILSARFELAVPNTRTLHLKTLNEAYKDFEAELKPELREAGGRAVYRWQFKDIPQIIPEANMPPEVEINPAFLVSSFSDWSQIYHWWWKLAKDKIASDGAIRKKVKELIAQAGSDEAKARSIYNFCAKEIRYVAVEYGQAGYEPHPASDIFKNKYGDCKDQAILLVTMLKEAGLVSWPVLISTKDYYNLNEDFPAPLFNHCIAAVALGGQTVFLDPTAETCPLGDLAAADQKRRVLVFKEDGYAIMETPLFGNDHNWVTHGFTVRLHPDETLDAEKKVLTSGVYQQAQRHWLLYTPPILIREQLQAKIQEFSIGAKLKRYDVRNLNNLDRMLELEYWFEGPEYFTPAGDLRIMPQLTSLDSALVSKEERKYPIDLRILDRIETKFVFTIPETFTVHYIPGNVSQDSQWLDYSCEYIQEGNSLVFTQHIALKKETISAQEYPRFKQFFEKLAKRIKQRIILERTRE